MFPWGCTGKQTVFHRPADLDRHYKNVHASSDQRDSFPCDYHKCGRANDPFTRKDHYRDHLRDFHKEDLGCAKGEKKMDKKKWAVAQRAWLAERKIYPHWWRCARCLERRQVKEDEWDCPTCKVSCEQERIEARKLQKTSMVDTIDTEEERGYHQSASSATLNAYYPCATCRENNGWLADSFGQWVECPDCNTSVAVETEYSADSYYN